MYSFWKRKRSEIAYCTTFGQKLASRPLKKVCSTRGLLWPEQRDLTFKPRWGNLKERKRKKSFQECMTIHPDHLLKLKKNKKKKQTCSEIFIIVKFQRNSDALYWPTCKICR